MFAGLDLYYADLAHLITAGEDLADLYDLYLIYLIYLLVFHANFNVTVPEVLTSIYRETSGWLSFSWHAS